MLWLKIIVNEPNNITLVDWVNKAFDQTKHQT
jgi:hypothetical protein